jgi:hypothetical protein
MSIVLNAPTFPDATVVSHPRRVMSPPRRWSACHNSVGPALPWGRLLKNQVVGAPAGSGQQR